jgi:hypothetical protein
VAVQHPLTVVEDHLHFMVAAVGHLPTTAVAAEHPHITEAVVAGQVVAPAAAEEEEEDTTHPAATAAIAKQ